MKKLLFAAFILFVLHLTSYVSPSPIFAQSLLKYPIPELGYCRDAKECHLYCEIPENKAACWSYGKFKLGPDVLGVTTEQEQQMQEKARALGITFPIAELGNCTTPTECRNYCEQPANRDSCMSFAKKKGFYKEVENDMDESKKDEMLQSARAELGCTSMESCKSICDSDHTRCETFARRHGVYQEPPENSEQRELIENARNDLGCTSMESCKSICEQNPQRCRAFTQKHGLDRAEERREEFREERMEQERTPPQAGQSGYGPADCKTEAECENYCKTNPSRCPGFREGEARTSPMPQQYQQQPPSAGETYSLPSNASGESFTPAPTQ